MKNQTSKITIWDRVMMAITFAEAGEHETAVDFLDKQSRNTAQNRLDKRAQKQDRPTLQL